MEERQCKDCGNFIQHYGLDSRKLYRLYCGHRRQPGARRKRTDATACEKFIPGTACTEAFATREYLSKALLNHVLNLELLPEIVNESKMAEQTRYEDMYSL